MTATNEPETGRAALSAGFTAEVAEAVWGFRLSANVLERARHAVLDWLGVAILGSTEPAAGIAREVARLERTARVATIVGTSDRVSPLQATLVNGIAGHALDYDDGNLWTACHPSDPMLPAILALAQELDVDGSAVVEAVVAGYQAEAMVGLALASAPSRGRGFHTTGTVGIFGSAAGCSRLLGLDALRTQRALGLAATEAAGLTASFGTMGKHLNAAKAAVDGLLAARLAEHDFTGATQALEADDGYIVAHTSGGEFDPQHPRKVMGDRLAVEEIFFKRHACCHVTHSAIEGAKKLRHEHGFSTDDIDQVLLKADGAVLDTVGIRQPASGLEGKFSIFYAATLALAGRDTGPAGFSDESVKEPELLELMQRVDFVPAGASGTIGATEVVVTLKDGRTISAAVPELGYNVVPDDRLPEQWTALRDKFLANVSPVLGQERATELIDAMSQLERLPSVAKLMELTETP